MRFLHTADWHLGRTLYGRKRYDEFDAFLRWLGKTIEEHGIEALLIAGDVFDTGTPSNRAQELYYSFLRRVSASCCRHILIIAGNHDSPSFLNAPGELLKALNVHVISAITEDVDDEVIPILDVENGTLDSGKSAIICAVPYLRDKDIRTVEPGETIDDKNRKLLEGMRQHYAEVAKIAERKREEITQKFKIRNPQQPIPIMAMGHLFTAGGKTVEGDGVRELYVGSLARIDVSAFPSSIDYLALGHLHVPQVVGGAEHIRYSGSPIPMGYGEATQQKSVVILDFDSRKPTLDVALDVEAQPAKAGTLDFGPEPGLGFDFEEPASNTAETSNNQKPTIKILPIPCFQQLVRMEGSLETIQAKLETLKKEASQAWLEIEYSGKDFIPNLQGVLNETVADSAMEIGRIKNRRIMDLVLKTSMQEESLEELDANDVFTRLLDTADIPTENRPELMASYKEIIKSLQEEDLNED